MILLLLALQASPVEQYLAEESPAARSRLLRKITGSLEEVERELRTPPVRPAVDKTGAVVRRTLKADHPEGGPFEYVLWVPASYTPDKTWRMIINLHGSGGTGDGALGRWLDDLKAADDTFLLCPSAKRGGWGGSLLGHAYILQSMRDVMERYAIDVDRVFLDGASMGGNGSFQFACLHPDLFAGAMPRSGGPRFRKDRETGKVYSEGTGNLVALPFYWVVGAKDRKLPHDWVLEAKARIEELKSDFTYREYPDGGHDWFRQENGRVLEWMKDRRRNAYPPRVSVHLDDRRFARHYWLEISRFRGKERIQRGFRDLKGTVIETRLAFHEIVQADAERVEGKNEVVLKTRGVSEVTLHLHPKMADLSKPLTVRVNGKRRTFRARPSLDVLMESARRDRGLLYTASVRVPVR